MQDLRLLAIEQEYVVLEGANGEKFRVALDEALRKAVRGDKSVLLEAESVSPREIQELVRSGHDISDIVARTGAAFSYVEKFALPVLEELDHIVSSAKSVRLSFLGERYGETNHIEFGALIREKLDQLDAKNVRWVAKRSETGGWQVSCNFDLDAKPSEAKWSFDLRHLSLSPENEVALNLATTSQSDVLVPKLRPVSVAPIADEPSAIAQATSKTDISPLADAPLVGKNLTSSLGATQEFAAVIPFGRGRNTTANVPVIAAGTSAEDDLDDEPATFDESEDLLDGLRRRRDQRESQSVFASLVEVVASHDEPAEATDIGIDERTSSDFDETTVWIDAADEVYVDEDLSEQDEQLEAEAAEEPAEEPAATPKRGRAAMPSWDEIVFGTRHENKDD